MNYRIGPLSLEAFITTYKCTSEHLEKRTGSIRRLSQNYFIRI